MMFNTLLYVLTFVIISVESDRFFCSVSMNQPLAGSGYQGGTEACTRPSVRLHLQSSPQRYTSLFVKYDI